MLLGPLVLTVSILGQAAPAAPAPSTDALAQAYLLFLQARDLEDHSDLRGAIGMYRRAADLAPNAADIRAEMASALARDGQTDAALTEAAAALKLDANNRAAHRLLGLMQAELAGETRDPARSAALIKDAIGHLEVVAADRLVDPLGEFTLGQLYVQAEIGRAHV